MKSIFRTALVAMIVADLAEIIAAMIDGMLTGRFLGAESIAAFGIAKPFFSITGVLSAVLSLGSMILASHVIGKGDRRKTNQIFSLTCFLGITLSIGFSFLGIMFVNQFAAVLGANGELFPIVRKYLAGLLLGVPAIVMGNILVVFMQLEGKYNKVNLSVFATITVNLGGDLFNIFYLNGDMFGMGLATSASYYAALAVLIYGFVAKHSMFQFSFSDIKWEMLTELINKGLPKATRRVCNIFRPVIINHLVLMIGGSLAMSAMSVQHSVAEFLELLGTCCGDVVVLMCGVFYGEENEDELSETLILSFKYVLFGVTAVTLISFFGAHGIASFYLGNQIKADLTTGENVKMGFACSAVRNGNFYGRNLDLDYADVPEFVIKVSAKEGRYASIGMAADLTLKSGGVDKVSEAELLALPNMTFDGINENGVAMNSNVAPAVDLDFATLLSTNYGKPRIHSMAVVRYVLDHAKSAAHGVELLKNMDIYGGYGTWWGLHWMLSDEKETYIIECIDGELVARNDTDNIMTNFYVNYAPKTLYAKHVAQTGQKVAGKADDQRGIGHDGTHWI